MFLKTPLLRSLFAVFLLRKIINLDLIVFTRMKEMTESISEKYDRKVYPHPFAFKADAQDGVTKKPANNKNKISACRVIL